MPQTQHKTEKLNLLRPRNLIIAGAVVALAGGGIFFWRSRPGSSGSGTGGSAAAPSVASRIKPPPLDGPRESLIKFAATPDFIRLPDEQRSAIANSLNNPQRFQEYMQLFAENKFTAEEALQSIGNVAGAIAVERSRQYAAATTPQQRTAIVDKAIDDKQRAEQDFGMRLMLGSMGQLTAWAPGAKGDPTPQGLKNWVETHSAQDRIRVTEFYKAIYDRMVERGLISPR